MKVSIIIPSYNEEKYIGRLLKSIISQDLNDFEIIVADADSTDNTRKICRHYGCKVVKGGRPAQGRNNGVKNSSGDILIFIDADVVLPSRSLKNDINEFMDRKLDIAGINLYPLSDKLFDIYTHFFYNSFQKISSHFDPLLSGALIIVKREVFYKVGGFNETIYIAEDHAFARISKKVGYRFGILKGYVFIDVRRFNYEGRVRIILKLLFFWMKRFFGEIKNSSIKYDLENIREMHK